MIKKLALMFALLLVPSMVLAQEDNVQQAVEVTPTAAQDLSVEVPPTPIAATDSAPIAVGQGCVNCGSSSGVVMASGCSGCGNVVTTAGCRGCGGCNSCGGCGTTIATPISNCGGCGTVATGCHGSYRQPTYTRSAYRAPMRRRGMRWGAVAPVSYTTRSCAPTYHVAPASYTMPAIGSGCTNCGQ